MDSDNISASWEMVLIDTATGLKKRELDWLLEELHSILVDLKHGLEDCYALLAPVDPGSTLVLSTPRNEIVKGTVTRVGTRIVKGVCCLQPTHPQSYLN
jgi:pyruvate-formate lyase-activating enzyme